MTAEQALDGRLMDATPSTEAGTSDGRRTRRWGVGLVALLAGLVLTFLSPAGAATALVYIGLLPTMVALTDGPRVAWGTAVCTGAVVFLGLLLSTTPWAAAVMMIALGLAVAWSYTKGWQGPATYVATQGALAAVAAPGSSFLPDSPHEALASAAVVAGFVLFGGLWAALVGSLLLYDLPRSPHEPPTKDELVTFAIILGAVLGIGTYLAVRFAPGSNVWWVLLTALVVLVPQHQLTMRRAFSRAGGTVLGGVLAALAIVLVPSSTATNVIGLLAAIASAVAYLRAPYWVFSATLTMALVLLSLPLGHALQGDLERVVYTVLAAGIVVAISAVANHTRHPRRRA